MPTQLLFIKYPSHSHLRILGVHVILLFLSHLITNYKLVLHHIFLGYLSNQHGVYLSNNSVQNQRTKHIEMDIHFVRKNVARGQICILHVPSRFQIADKFTKALLLQLFHDIKNSFNIRLPPIFTRGCINHLLFYYY